MSPLIPNFSTSEVRYAGVLDNLNYYYNTLSSTSDEIDSVTLCSGDASPYISSSFSIIAFYNY